MPRHAADPTGSRRRSCPELPEQIEDDDPTIRVVVVDFGGPRTGRPAVERELQTRLVFLAPRALLLFPLPNLFDDERR
jgi:hypothetical protein